MQYFPHTLRFISILIALNYFSFRVELFEEEAEANQPGAIPTHLAFSAYSVNWETFDKDNAPKAFVINPSINIFVIGIIPATNNIVCCDIPDYEPIRDKSPPAYLVTI
jgi:hypothetical protein